MGTKPNETTETELAGDATLASKTALVTLMMLVWRVWFGVRAMLQQWWTVLTRPRIATFDAEQDGANWMSVIIQVVVLGVVGALLGALLVQTNVLAALLIYVPSEFLDFFVIAGLFFGAARVFGGTGRFLPFAYALALIYVPLQLVGVILSFPLELVGITVHPLLYVAFYLPLALLLYTVFVAMFATASVHHLPLRRAGIAVLAGFVVLFILNSLLSSVVGVPII